MSSYYWEHREKCLEEAKERNRKKNEFSRTATLAEKEQKILEKYFQGGVTNV